jgi:hypothetical protein
MPALISAFVAPLICNAIELANGNVIWIKTFFGDYYFIM